MSLWILVVHSNDQKGNIVDPHRFSEKNIFRAIPVGYLKQRVAPGSLRG